MRMVTAAAAAIAIFCLLQLADAAGRGELQIPF